MKRLLVLVEGSATSRIPVGIEIEVTINTSITEMMTFPNDLCDIDGAEVLTGESTAVPKVEHRTEGIEESVTSNTAILAPVEIVRHLSF